MNTTICVKGMSCNHCVMAVKKALGEVGGITDAQVDLQKGEVTFSHEAPVDMGVVKDRLERAGYDVG